MVSLYLDPQGEKIFDKSNPTANHRNGAPATLTSDPQGGVDVVSVLQQKLQEQELEIEAKDKKIKKLVEELRTAKVIESSLLDQNSHNADCLQ